MSIVTKPQIGAPSAALLDDLGLKHKRDVTKNHDVKLRSKSARLHKADWDKFQWLAQDLGFTETEVHLYAASALRVYSQLVICSRDEGKSLFYGVDVRRATRFTLRPLKDGEYLWSDEPEDQTLNITLTEGQWAAVEQACTSLTPLDRFLWRALWEYYDVFGSYEAGLGVFAGSELEPEEQILFPTEVKPPFAQSIDKRRAEKTA